MIKAIDFSDKTSEAIDQAVSSFVNTNYELATQILNENREALDRLAEGLILWETLDYEQVKNLSMVRILESRLLREEVSKSESILDELYQVLINDVE